MKHVLVLLIGEVLEDPRVLKTCRSLASYGVDVTVACTNPSNRPAGERSHGFSIVRFPHPAEYVLKRLFHWIKGWISPSVGGAMGRIHETAPGSPLKSALRNAVLARNFEHRMKSALAVNRRMVERFRGEAFDLVHANDMDTLAAACELKRLGVARAMLYDSHEYWPGIGVHGSVANAAIRRIEKEGIAFADYVVTVNDMIAERLREDYGLHAKPTAIMNCSELTPPSKDTAVHDPVRVVYQGKLQAFRGLDILIEAFSIVAGATLTFSGFGPLEESLKRLVSARGLTGRVTFAGKYLPHETIAVLDGFDIGVIPHQAVTENISLSSPTKMFDYSMAGLAIASSGLPFVKNAFAAYNSGVIIDSLTPEGIAATITRMSADREGLSLRKKNARHAAEAEYSWERQFDRYPWRP